MRPALNEDVFQAEGRFPKGKDGDARMKKEKQQ